ncbi:hypothetical protein [Tunicatimonas pelagia]|uniref:hypothetical protein n=1 Tax=Tunicatimonas pelagia TaxID=931531 RepID=UPI0026655ECD|nr:hypothetical protein [Tunicatimonas pelagia]WKN42986.1 hypothetical protein P0M28_28510 [Tunicatimonas pelagia]
MNFLLNSISKKIGTVAIISALVFVGCGDDDPAPAEGLGEYAMVTTSLNADGQTRGFYLQRVSIDNTETLDNSDATELSAATFAMMHSFGGSIYFSDYGNGMMEKWSIDTSNNAIMEANMNVSELSFQGNTAFKDENTAFVGGISTNIIIFNPTTMQKTGTIDISSALNIGNTTDFPQPGGTIAAEPVTEILIRDNLLFAALMPLADIATFSPGEKGCSIVIIDTDKIDANAQGNADAVVKRIFDERGSATGAWGSGGGSPFMHLDERGDIYVLCHNSWGGLRAAFDRPACALKVAAGTTDFDESYYFDLESAARGNGSPVVNMEYYGNGKFLGAAQDPSAIDPNNPDSYFVDPIFQWWSFDLYNQTAEIVAEEYTRAAVASVTYFEDGFGYVPFEANGEQYVMKVDLNTLETSKQFNTVGTPHLFSLQ